MAVQEKCHVECMRNLTLQDGDTLPSRLEKSIKAIIKKEGFETYTVFTEDIELDGANYLAGLFSVDIKGKTQDGHQEINIFFKLMKPEEQLEIFSVEGLYLTEVFVYTELTEVFKDLQKEFNVPEKERYKMVKSFGEACGPDMIVLENMVKKGYETPSRLDVMDLNYASLAMKELAKLHALSFALQERRPEYFNRKIKSLEHPFHFNDAFKLFMHSLCDMVCTSVDDKHKELVQAFKSKIVDKYRGHMEDEAKRSLVHGDYRPNNIMMKIDNGQIIDLIPVDYQLLYYGNPIQDLIYFIYSCTDQQFRRNHLEDLKRVYYEQLESFLQYFNVDVNLVFPRKEFESEFNEKRDYGLILSLIVLPLIMTVDNNDIDLADPAKKKQVKFDDKFKQRITEILDEFVEMGFL